MDEGNHTKNERFEMAVKREYTLKLTHDELHFIMAAGLFTQSYFKGDLKQGSGAIDIVEQLLHDKSFGTSGANALYGKVLDAHDEARAVEHKDGED